VNTLGTDNGTPIITVSGHPVQSTNGNLNLTTVSVDTQNTNVVGAIHGWLAHDAVVVPHDSVYPPGQTQQQTNEQDQQDFVASQDSAIQAAACELGYPKAFGVLSISDGSANKNALHPSDEFVSVGGKSVSDLTSLQAALSGRSTGDKVPAVVLRNGTKVDVTLTIMAPAAGSTSPRLGIAVASGCMFPFQVEIGLGGIGGPSAGMMFALGIIDKVGPPNLTMGRFIAGTGTIDGDGNVGAIGGIQLKMMGARRDGATVFLAPESNCADVRGNIPAGLNVIKVGTLGDAVSSLEELEKGDTASLAHC
jgi:PDZ domain-containing protein